MITFVSEQDSMDMSFYRNYIHHFYDRSHTDMSVKFMSSQLRQTHSGPNVLCPRICVLIKILLLFIRKNPDNENALVQVIDGLTGQAFTWINTGPVYRYAYAPF